MENTNELFALPINQKVVLIFDKRPLYGSDSLNKKFKEAINKSSITKTVSKEIETLVDKKQIIVCFAEKGLIKFYKSKFEEDPNSLSYMTYGFFLNDIKKVLLFINNNVNVFGYGSNNELAKLTIHELVHMAASKNKRVFHSLYLKDLILFYKIYFGKVFNLKGNYTKEVEKYIEYLLFKVEGSRLIKPAIIHECFQSLKPYSKLNSIEFDELSILMIRAIRLFLMHPRLFYQTIKTFRDILIPFYETYNEAFDYNCDRGVCQELIFPSEVIAILSESGTFPHTKNLIQSLV